MKKRLTIWDIAISKTILLILLIVLGVFTVIAYKLNVIVGAIMMLFFMAVFGVFIDMPAIKAWLDDFFNNKDW